MSYISKSRLNNLKNHISWIQNEIKRLSLKLSEEKKKQETVKNNKKDRKYNPIIYLTKERTCFVERVDKRKINQIISVYDNIVQNFRYDLRKLEVQELSEDILSKIERNITLLQKEIWSYHGKVPFRSSKQEDDMIRIKETFTNKVVTRFNNIRFKWDDLMKPEVQKKKDARKNGGKKNGKSGERSIKDAKDRTKKEKDLKVSDKKKKKYSSVPSRASEESSDSEDNPQLCLSVTHHRHKKKKKRH